MTTVKQPGPLVSVIMPVWNADEIISKTAYLPFVQNVQRYDASADMAVPVHQMQKIAADIYDAAT
jgi:hypothetical protein